MPVTFIKSGQKTYVESSPEGMKTSKLEPAIYSIECSREEGFYLLRIEDKYKLPSKLYGNYEKVADRVINTHYSKTGNTGILLTGLKGTGKTVFVKMLANEMLKRNIPVIQINKAFNGDDLFNFVENIGECALLFDEFGKNYSPYANSQVPSQVSLLSLFDGLSNNKRLHLFTENDKNEISTFLINRPGRVHYHFHYNRLTTEIIKELCKDNNLPDEVTEELLGLSGKIKVLSFDVVKCLIDEWKLYGGSIEEHIKILNITLMGDKAQKDVEIISIISPEGKSLVKANTTASLRGDRIFIDGIVSESGQDDLPSWGTSSGGANDTIELDKIVDVKNDIYTFTTVRNNIAMLKINVPLHGS